MPLSARLRDVGSTLECGRCGHLIIKKGGWFIAPYIFKCPECKGEVRLQLPKAPLLPRLHSQHRIRDVRFTSTPAGR
jgi:hypothetical protein